MGSLFGLETAYGGGHTFYELYRGTGCCCGDGDEFIDGAFGGSKGLDAGEEVVVSVEGGRRFWHAVDGKLGAGS